MSYQDVVWRVGCDGIKTFELVSPQTEIEDYRWQVGSFPAPEMNLEFRNDGLTSKSEFHLQTGHS
jgi:hypothetical protein